MVEEDDRYHIGVLNMNAKNIILTMEVNVSAKVYDTTKAKKMCSTENGPCRLSFFFPDTHYVILTAANNVRHKKPCLTHLNLEIFTEVIQQYIVTSIGYREMG
ncbi:hypothetical protein V8G54_005305 [Vigna mungo]|uniref:E3 ubiquitin-protein ligase APD1-4 middle domain-containing protein n=1 Tax=Vigna mungo TaxID=3915 RepID=A0AAQ3NYE8_VIGMU